MKKLLILLLLIVSISANAATYYISPTGSNSNTGGISSPWLTLTYACAHATAPGDIIHVNAGTYVTTAQCVLAAGVSIEGVGVTSVISSTITTTYVFTIDATSTSEGTNGNQHISGIKMTGGSLGSPTAYGAIMVDRRSNVSIYNCTIEHFFKRGVVMVGSTWGSGLEPTTLATGNSFHDNILTNCSDYSGVAHSGAGCGELEIGGQRGLLIYNNTITEPDRGTDATGFCIKYSNDGYNRGTKIYNNTISRPAYDGSTWDFALELWNDRGGLEIYNNNIQGSIDISGSSSLTYDVGHYYGYAVKIYNNVIGFATMQGGEQLGIDIERGQTDGFYVYNNIFKNISTPLQFWQGDLDVVENLYFYYNIFNGVGAAGQSNYGNVTDFGTIDNHNVTYDNINFINNVCYAGATGDPGTAFRLDPPGTMTNVTIRNNIVQGFNQPVYIEEQYGEISTVSIEKNIFYGNTSNNVLTYGTPTNVTNQNNLTSDPKFVTPGSDFHLQASSPAINAGIHIAGYTLDFSSAAVGNPPEIGAYEYGTSSVSVPAVTTIAVTNYTTTSVVSGGNVTSDGGAAVTDRGLCWATTVNPDTGDNVIHNSSGTGIFSSSITGLTENQVYHVRAFATNSVGTAYGSDIQFSTRAFMIIVR